MKKKDKEGGRQFQHAAGASRQTVEDPVGAELSILGRRGGGGGGWVYFTYHLVPGPLDLWDS